MCNSLSKNSINLATISISNVVNGDVNEVITNEKGDFKLLDIPFGEYVLTTYAEGFEKSTIYNVVLMKEKPIVKISRIELSKSVELKTGKVIGSVFDNTNNEAIQYAAITIYNCLDYSLMGISVIDENGYFVLNNLPFGEYCLNASFVGFQDKKIHNVVLMRQKPKVKFNKIELIPEEENNSGDLIF